MQCIFIVNNNIQKKKEGREKGKVSFTEKTKGLGDKQNKRNTNTNQTKPYLKTKYDLNARFLKLQKYFFLKKRSAFIQKWKDAIL